MPITRLQLYNNALLLCGERFLASLTENREPRHLLDQVWNTNGIDTMLEQAQWHHAMRAVQIDYDPTQARKFGYNHAFSKPDDWISTSAVCQDEYYNTPLLAYSFEQDFWYCDLETIYVKYVSNDAAYGADLTRWPGTFQDYAAAYFASRIIGTLAGDRSAQSDRLFGPPGMPSRGLLAKTLDNAKTKAAITQPTQFLPPGLWVQSHRGRRGSRNDRGNTNTLIG